MNLYGFEILQSGEFKGLKLSKIGSFRARIITIRMNNNWKGKY
jgi:hypothetical protein